MVDQPINQADVGDTPVPPLPPLAKAAPPPNIAVDLRGVAISFVLADGKRYDAVQPQCRFGMGSFWGSTPAESLSPLHGRYPPQAEFMFAALHARFQ